MIDNLFDNIADKLKGAVEVGVKEVVGVVDVQKLKIKLNDLEKKEKELYVKIGKTVWENRENPAYAAFGDDFEALDAVRAEYIKLVESLAAAKGQKRCDGCGSFNPTESRFCSQCGKSI